MVSQRMEKARSQMKRAKRELTPEGIVVRDLRAFMAEQGWRDVRNESGFVPGAGSFGEKGMADWLFIRYLDLSPGSALIIWVEAKPPGYKPRGNKDCWTCHPELIELGRGGKPKKGYECRSCGQRRWAKVEQSRGAIVLQVSDVEKFKQWYFEKFFWLPAPPPPQPQTSLF